MPEQPRFDILDKFTSHLKNVLARSYSLAVETESPDINPEHLLLSLLLQKGSLGGEVWHKADVGPEPFRAFIRMMKAKGPDKSEDAGAKTVRHTHTSPQLSADA